MFNISVVYVGGVSPKRETITFYTDALVAVGAHKFEVDSSALAHPNHREHPAKFTEPWVWMFSAGLQRLSRDRDLEPAALRVLLELFSHAPSSETEWEIKPAEIERVTGISRVRVSALITSLENRGYIKRARRGWVQFEPKVAWSGKAKAREVLLEQMRLAEMEKEAGA